MITMQTMKQYWANRKLSMPLMTEELGRWKWRLEDGTYEEYTAKWYFWSYAETRFIPFQWIRNTDSVRFQRMDLVNDDCIRWGIIPTSQQIYVPVEWTEYIRKDLYIAEGIPDVLTLCEAGLMAIGAKNNKAVLSLEWQTGFKRFVEVVKPSQVIYVPDNERPAFWNAKQDNVRYWHETFQRLVPKSWCVDWRQLQRQEFEAYRAWCVSWWKQQHRKPQRDEDTFAWQKSDVNDLWCAATSKAAFLQALQRCLTRTPLYPTVQFGSKPKMRDLPVIQDVERALAPLVRKISDAPQQHRNNVLFWAACRAAEKGFGGEAKSRLLLAALQRGLPQYEAERTIASAFKRAA